MNTTQLIKPQIAAGLPGPSTDARRNARPSASEHPTVGQMLEQIDPLIGVVAVAGPPVVFLAGPLLLVVLMLVGPFALLLTLVVAATVLGGLVGAILATPYLLVRYVRAYRATHAHTSDSAAQLVPAGSTRVGG